MGMLCWEPKQSLTNYLAAAQEPLCGLPGGSQREWSLALVSGSSFVITCNNDARVVQKLGGILQILLTARVCVMQQMVPWWKWYYYLDPVWTALSCQIQKL